MTRVKWCLLVSSPPLTNIVLFWLAALTDRIVTRITKQIFRLTTDNFTTSPRSLTVRADSSLIHSASKHWPPLLGSFILSISLQVHLEISERHREKCSETGRYKAISTSHSTLNINPTLKAYQCQIIFLLLEYLKLFQFPSNCFCFPRFSKTYKIKQFCLDCSQNKGK